MFISNLDLLKAKLAAEGKMNESQMLKAILKDDLENPKKQFMRKGVDYYEGRHDIYDHDFRTSVIHEEDERGNPYDVTVTNENNSNHHNVHRFHTQQVRQKVAYILGKPLSVTVEGAENNAELKAFEDEITRFTSDEEFINTMVKWCVAASNKGTEWLHVYYDENGERQYVVCPAEEIIPFYDTMHQKKLVELIRYYSIAVIKNGEEVLRKKVEWWTRDNVTYYEEDDEGNFILDYSHRPNPAPHWTTITSVDGAAKKSTPHSWGRIPFIALHNNDVDESDLSLIKPLADAYDLISSSSTNNQIDLVELYWMIQGYGGETAKAIAKKLMYNHAVEIADPNGKISAEQVTLNVSERLEFLKMLRRDIYYFGMAIDTDTDKFGTAPSGVSLKFQYTQLDMKADLMISGLKLALKEFFWFIVEDMNAVNETSYDSSLIRADVNKSIITNDLETVQIITQSKGLVPDVLLLAHHPMVDDVNQAIKELEAQKKKEADTFLNSDVPPDNEDDDE